MKLQLLGIAFILFGIAWLMYFGMYGNIEVYARIRDWGGVLILPVGLIITIIGTVKRGKE